MEDYTTQTILEKYMTNSTAERFQQVNPEGKK